MPSQDRHVSCLFVVAAVPATEPAVTAGVGLAEALSPAASAALPAEGSCSDERHQPWRRGCLFTLGHSLQGMGQAAGSGEGLREEGAVVSASRGAAAWLWRWVAGELTPGFGKEGWGVPWLSAVRLGCSAWISSNCCRSCCHVCSPSCSTLMEHGGKPMAPAAPHKGLGGPQRCCSCGSSPAQ